MVILVIGPAFVALRTRFLPQFPPGHWPETPHLLPWYLPCVAPDYLRDAENCQDRAINRPMIITDHESPAKCKVESLQNPDESHGSHYQPNDAAHDSHDDIECVEHVFPSPAVVGQFEFSELTRQALFVSGGSILPQNRRSRRFWILLSHTFTPTISTSTN
jgi:hypothetical protein